MRGCGGGVAKVLTSRSGTEHGRELLREGWFKFFRLMDDDNSGRIAYRELVSGVREQLNVRKAAAAG